MSESNVELAPHGQILTFRAGKIAEMVVYGSVAEAFQAAGAA
jgi:hypothetical protein